MHPCQAAGAPGEPPCYNRPAVRLVQLSLRNFRNFRELETAFPPGPTLLIGANAQGKTSLLESIHYLTAASSRQARSDRELIHFGARGDRPAVARVAGVVSKAGSQARIEIRLVLEQAAPGAEPRLRKQVLIDGLNRRVAGLRGVFQAVLFLPQDLRAIEGPPAERRRLLDTTLAQGDATYAQALSEHAKVLAQRNALLKSLQAGRGEGRQLAFWDQRLALLAARLMLARAAGVAELQAFAGPLHAELTRGREALKLQYQPVFDPFPEGRNQLGSLEQPKDPWEALTTQSLGDRLLAELQRARQGEIARGMTLIGPHRDDLCFWLNQVDLRTFGSRGQNRTAMLALKLAEVDWPRRRTDEEPLLLLDEVLAELDPERREALLRRARAAEQSVLGAADLAMFDQDFQAQATIWQVVNGRLEALKAPRRGGG